jgi:acyl dehydratase
MADEDQETEIDRIVDGSPGRWYDELAVGTRYRHSVTRTVTEADNVWFTTMTMNPQPLHLDASYAAGTEFGRPLVNSLFTLALVVGLSVAELTLRTTVANLGFEAVTFPAPVFAGDTIRAETDILAKRPARSRPGQGIVSMRHRGVNQGGTVVCEAVRSALVRSRPPEV